jgi:signal transduction histidine kinase
MIKEKLKSIEYNNYYPLFFTIIFILILIQYSFSTLDAIFYDLWVKLDFGVAKNNQTIIITLDEESDEFLGEVYPYTYATHSRLLEKLVNDDPTMINYFVELLEPDSVADQKYFNKFKKLIVDYKETPGEFLFASDIDSWGEQIPPKGLNELGYYLGHIHKDGQVFAKDEVARRALLNISGEDSIHLKIANHRRKVEGKEKLDIGSFTGAYYNKEADATFALYRFFTDPNKPNGDILSIPFHRVFAVPKGFFKGKTILIGPKYISNPDHFVLSPYKKDGIKTPKMYIHQVIVEALSQGKTIYPIPEWVSDLLSILIAVFLSYIISRVRPTRGLMITIFIMIGMFFLSFSIFVGLGLWLKMSHIILSIFVVYYIWVPFRAIGEYQTRYAIQEEAKLLSQVDNLKRNFISLMSHDLKTPVAKIAGIADILSVQYDNTPDQKKLINNIINSTKELNRFITSILDLTKVESRNLTLKMVPKDINQIIESAVDKLKFEATSNEITVETDLSPLYPVKVDVELMNRVFSNLIENAIKYSGQGKNIEITTKDDDTWVYIDIKDNGVGIGPDDLDHIFDKFYRVKNDSSHKIKGSGLGLYLVKYFVELHNGEITASSEVGKGTTFTVKLKNE